MTYHTTEYKLINHHSITLELTTLDLFSRRNQREQDQQQEKWDSEGAQFTCLNTWAGHLEIVWDFTTDAFVLALRRFCSRRRYPHIIQSDNGKKNFGVESKLKTALKGLDTKRIKEQVNDNQTKWLFNPLCSPWMSGAMESLVNVTKRALKTLIVQWELSHDALYTIMTEVESIVNSQALLIILMITRH